MVGFWELFRIVLVLSGMNTSPHDTDNNSLAPHPVHRTFINPSLWFEDCDGYRVFFCRHEILYRVALQDHPHLKIIAVTLRQSRLATQQDIATAFGHTVGTQRRWEKLYAQSGSTAFTPKPHTGRPPRVDVAQHALVRRWFRDNLSNADMARRLAVDEATVRRLLRRLGLSRSTPSPSLFPPPPTPPPPDQTPTPPPQDQTSTPPTPDQNTWPTPGDDATDVALPLLSSPQTTQSRHPAEPVPPSSQPQPLTPQPTAALEPCVQTFTVDRNPLDRWGDRLLASRGLLEDAVPLFANATDVPRAGVLLAIPALQEHGGLRVFQRLYQSLGAGFYGLRTTVFTLIVLAWLRIKRPEQLKEYDPQALGRLLGLDRAPEVKTLRRKLALMTERSLTGELLEELTRTRVAQQAERVAFLYLDGHVREYTGQEPLPKAKKAQRAVATAATTDTWVHDAHGEPLLVVTSEMNASLTKVLLPIIADVQKLLPAGQRVTAVFDRGGWSPKLFARLFEAGVDVITYRKGKTRKLAEDQFVEHRVQVDGQEKVYRLCDQRRVRVGRLRPRRKKRCRGEGPQYLWMRQVTVLRDDGRQTVTLTNRQDLGEVEVVRRLFGRWRQENYEGFRIFNGLTCSKVHLDAYLFLSTPLTNGLPA